MKKMQVAVIGCGAIACNEHIPAYHKNPMAEIKYLVDMVPEVEAVSICTANHTQPV